MTRFQQGSVTEIPTGAAHVHAFRVSGTMDAETSVALAEHMNGVFDAARGDVNMLFDLTGFESGGAAGLFDGDVLRSRLRAVDKVARYAVIGAPKAAARMIGIMDRIVPVDARTFAPDEADAAWDFVTGRPHRA